jgi:RNA polymerase sigma factor (sigma-70 family)
VATEADLDEGNPDTEGRSQVADEAEGFRSRRGGAAPVDETLLSTWIARVVDRDEAALGALYDALIGRVYGLALRIAGQAQVAEEVAEDTFWQVWRQAPRFDPARGTALAWIMTIARSRALDARRAMDPAECTDDPESLMATGTEGDLSDWAAAEQAGSRLHAALAGLDAVPRQLVALAFFRGLSHDEIALQTDLPLGTVKSQIRRALLRLRQILTTDDANGLDP